MERVEAPTTVQTVTAAVQTAAAPVQTAAAAIGIDIGAALADTPAPAPTPEQVQQVAPIEVSPMDIAVEPVKEAEIAQAKAESQATKANEEIEGTEIASIRSDYWGGFTAAIETVSANLGSEDVVSIKKGKLVASKDGGIIDCNLTNLFGDQDWDIQDPNLNLKLLKLIRGGDTITIMKDGNKNLIYSSSAGKIHSSIAITTPDTTNFKQTELVDLGTIKTKFEIDKDAVKNLITARNIYSALYYNVTIDTNTFEILSIDVDDKFKEVFHSATGRETMRYKVRELFPTAKPDSIILEIYDNAGSVFIRSVNDYAITTIYFQIEAITNEVRADLDFDDM